MLPQHLKRMIFDADDTLWENNIYYIRAAEDLVKLLQETGEPEQKIERDFQILEHEVVKSRGYGSANYVYILRTLFRRYYPEKNSPQLEKRFEGICRSFEDHVRVPPRVFPQVEAILSALKQRYDLYVLTKGNIEEQWLKLHKSGLLPYFNESFVEAEKNLSTYQKLLQTHLWIPGETCMIGNSPKSDINPALRAGLWAIYIPYEFTWVLDDEPILPGYKSLLTIPVFSDILKLLT